MRTTLAFLLLALAGCTGVDGETYLGAPGSPAWFATASPSTIATHYRSQCEAYGFKAGTPEMAYCIQNEAGSGRNRASNRLAAAQIAIAANNAQPRPVRTTCTQAYGYVNCTSY